MSKSIQSEAKKLSRTYNKAINDWNKKCGFPPHRKTNYFSVPKSRKSAKIKPISPSYIKTFEKTKKQNSNGCYIATCVYGSYNCPEVWTLRRYRDYVLYKNSLGKAFIRLYYSVSPKIVRLFGNSTCFKKICKYLLNKWVLKLNSKGLQNTPYNDMY